MALKIVGAIAIVSMVWNIYNFVKICLLEDKICYQKEQIEAMIRSQPTQTNAQKKCVGCALKQEGR